MKTLATILTTAILTTSSISANTTQKENLSHLSNTTSQVLEKSPKAKSPKIVSFKTALKRGIKYLGDSSEIMFEKNSILDSDFYMSFALHNPEVIKVIDDRGNLVSLYSSVSDTVSIEANATYNEDDQFVYGIFTQDDYWTEESIIYGETIVTSTTLDSNGLSIIKESPIAFAETSVEKFNSNGFLILKSESVGDTITFQVEKTYDDENRTIYKKSTYENGWNETTISYSEDGTVKKAFSGESTFSENKAKNEKISFTKTENKDGNTVIQYIGAESGTVYSEEIFNDETESYHKYTDDTGYWIETTTSMDKDSETMTILTIDSNDVKITQIIPLNYGYDERDNRGYGYDKELGQDNRGYDYDKEDETVVYDQNMVNSESYLDVTPSTSADSSATPPAVLTSNYTAYDITPNFIDNLPSGWNLIGASRDVDLEILKGVKSIFKYDATQQAWEYVQFDESGESVREEGNLRLNAFDGFWINK